MIKPIARFPALNLNELDDAEFRAKDRAWSSLVSFYEEAKEADPALSYESIGRRIKRSRKQVQRWLNSPFNMTLKSFGLLAEGLNADFSIRLIPREEVVGVNYCHPSEDARIALQPLEVPSTASGAATSDIMSRATWHVTA